VDVAYVDDRSGANFVTLATGSSWPNAGFGT
jgi:hypothetical protein